MVTHELIGDPVPAAPDREAALIEAAMEFLRLLSLSMLVTPTRRVSEAAPHNMGNH
jgi:hypothetical protein